MMTFLFLIVMSNPDKQERTKNTYINTKKSDWDKIKQESFKFKETSLNEYMNNNAGKKL